MKNKLKKEFNHKHSAIAKYIYNYDKGYNNLTSKEIISKFHISASTLTKFVQHMGFESFQSMNTQLYIFENLESERDNNFVFNDILTTTQQKSYLDMFMSFKEKKNIKIVYSDKYKNISQEIYDRYKNYSENIFLYDNNVDFSQLEDAEHIIVYGFVDVDITTYLLESKKKTTIIGYTNEVLFTPPVTNIDYLLFDRESFETKIDIVLLTNLLFVDLGVYNNIND